MISNGANLPGINSMMPIPTRTEKKEIPAVKPVEKSNRSTLSTMLDRDSTSKTNEAALPANIKEARLAIEILAEELKASPDLEVGWSLDQERGQLIVEIRNKDTGKILRQIPPEEMLSGLTDQDLDSSGVLIDITA